MCWYHVYEPSEIISSNPYLSAALFPQRTERTILSAGRYPSSAGRISVAAPGTCAFTLSLLVTAHYSFFTNISIFNTVFSRFRSFAFHVFSQKSKREPKKLHGGYMYCPSATSTDTSLPADFDMDYLFGKCWDTDEACGYESIDVDGCSWWNGCFGGTKISLKS